MEEAYHDGKIFRRHWKKPSTVIQVVKMPSCPPPPKVCYVWAIPSFAKEVHVFARIVSMRLKPNMTAEFTQTIEKRILPILRKQKGFRDEITFVAPGGMEAVGISLWDSREQADAYNSGGYSEVLRELNKLVEGTPQVKTYDVANSIAHNIAARSAA